MTLMRIRRRLAALRPAVLILNTGSCNGCDVELAAAWGPRYDAERFGFRRVHRLEDAGILVVTGPVSSGARSLIEQIAAQAAAGELVVVAVGACALSGGPFAGCPAVEGPVDRFVRVDVRVAGCPPKPQALLDALLEARRLLSEGRAAPMTAPAPDVVPD